jgi:hypothetical protein
MLQLSRGFRKQQHHLAPSTRNWPVGVPAPVYAAGGGYVVKVVAGSMIDTSIPRAGFSETFKC